MTDLGEPNTNAPVDRESRDAVAAALQSWLNKQISSDELQQVCEDLRSDDPTIREAIGSDIVHLVLGSPEWIRADSHGWNRTQRLLLVLASDYHLQTEDATPRALTFRTASGCLLAVLLSGYWHLRLSWPFAALWVACNAGAAVLWYGQKRYRRALYQRAFNSLDPFSSQAELLAVARSVPSFRMEPVPEQETASMPSRSPPVSVSRLWDALMLMVMWSIAGPIFLLTMLFPGIYRLKLQRVVASRKPAELGADRRGSPFWLKRKAELPLVTEMSLEEIEAEFKTSFIESISGACSSVATLIMIVVLVLASLANVIMVALCIPIIMVIQRVSECYASRFWTSAHDAALYYVWFHARFSESRLARVQAMFDRRVELLQPQGILGWEPPASSWFDPFFRLLKKLSRVNWRPVFLVFFVLPAAGLGLYLIAAAVCIVLKGLGFPLPDWADGFLR
jgi:hypothetical protein